MRKYSLPLIALALVATLGALHFIAEVFYLYWAIWWFDNVMHLLAGFAGGFVVVWLLSRRYELHKQVFSNFESILIVVISVLVVGVAWEIFEYVNEITQTTESYNLDMSLDLFFDILGATLAGIFGVKRFFRVRD